MDTNHNITDKIQKKTVWYFTISGVRLPDFLGKYIFEKRTQNENLTIIYNFHRGLLKEGLTHGGLVWGLFRFKKLKYELEHFKSIGWAWVRARAHPFDFKCLSIYFLKLKVPTLNPHVLPPPFLTTPDHIQFSMPKH